MLPQKEKFSLKNTFSSSTSLINCLLIHRKTKDMSDYLKSMQVEMKNRNYATNSINTYCDLLEQYLRFSERKKYLEPGERMKEYLYSLKDTAEKARLSYQAIKLFYVLVLKKDCPYTLEKIKKRKRLPITLSKPEILKIIATIPNKKH
jgi:site-specific recombinase XerD